MRRTARKYWVFEGPAGAGENVRIGANGGAKATTEKPRHGL
jgi:hypothetical protein